MRRNLHDIRIGQRQRGEFVIAERCLVSHRDRFGLKDFRLVRRNLHDIRIGQRQCGEFVIAERRLVCHRDRFVLKNFRLVRRNLHDLCIGQRQCGEFVIAERCLIVHRLGRRFCGRDNAIMRIRHVFSRWGNCCQLYFAIGIRCVLLFNDFFSRCNGLFRVDLRLTYCRGFLFWLLDFRLCSL